LKIFDEIQNKEQTVSGLIFKFCKQAVFFIDENYTTYNMDIRDVIPANYFSFEEKIEIENHIKKYLKG